MFLKEVLLTYETMISIIVAVTAIGGIYLKIRLELSRLALDMEKHKDEIDLKIEAINCDRKIRWDEYKEKQDKQDTYQSDILQGVNEIRIKIAGMEKNIDWLKKSK